MRYGSIQYKKYPSPRTYTSICVRTGPTSALSTMGEQASLRKRSSGAQLGERDQAALALLSKARAKQQEVENVEARMDEIAGQVDGGLNRDTERTLLREMSQLRRRKQELQKEAMAALDDAAGLAPKAPGVPAELSTGSRPSGTVRQTSSKPMSRTQRAAAESTPGALLKAQSASGESEIDWCALVMVYVKAAAMFAFVFWLVRLQLTCNMLERCSVSDGAHV